MRVMWLVFKKYIFFLNTRKTLATTVLLLGFEQELQTASGIEKSTPDCSII